MENTNQEVFERLEELGISLVDRMQLATSAQYLEHDLSYNSLDEPVTNWDFFDKNRYLYYFIQNGANVSFEKLNPSQSFLAHRKSKNLAGKNELLYYKPVSN